MFKFSKEILIGGKGDNQPDSKFDIKKLKVGIKEESEHTNNKSIAKEIAKDHLIDDSNYYQKIKKIEKEAARDNLNNVVDNNRIKNMDNIKYAHFKGFCNEAEKNGLSLIKAAQMYKDAIGMPPQVGPASASTAGMPLSKALVYLSKVKKLGPAAALLGAGTLLPSTFTNYKEWIHDAPKLNAQAAKTIADTRDMYASHMGGINKSLQQATQGINNDAIRLDNMMDSVDPKAEIYKSLLAQQTAQAAKQTEQATKQKIDYEQLKSLLPWIGGGAVGVGALGGAALSGRNRDEEKRKENLLV